MIRLLLILSLFFASILQLNADVIVRTQLQQGSASPEILDIRLFEGAAPLTVGNFLNYVNNTTANGGNYDNMFFHRTVTNFVIQGGGFTYDPLLNDGSFSYDSINDLFLGGLQSVLTDLSVTNELNKSNIRGTIAMAKMEGDPNSATSQWFFNLADNSANLDNTDNNGGFTVFGEVLGTGMDIIDAIALIPTEDITAIHSAFGELPLVGYTLGDPVLQSNLVRVNSMAEMLSITSDIDFGVMLINTSNQIIVSITNKDTTDLVIGAIADLNAIATPFSIVGGSNSCSGATLPQSSTCTFLIEFIPLLENTYSDSFNIELASLSISYNFSVTGMGALVVGPEITPSITSIDFGEVQLYDPANGAPVRRGVSLTNDGNTNLNISLISLTGVNASEFEFFDFCTTNSPIQPGEFCNIVVDFKPTVVGDKTALFTIISDDLDEDTLTVSVTGIAGLDNDTVSTTIENLAPNNGDGNNDDIPDSEQSNVISINTGNGYITVLIDKTSSFTEFSLIDNPQLGTLPDNVSLAGVYQYETNTTTGLGANVGIILPRGVVPKSYYLYGPTPDNINPHWYKFEFDGLTGAQIIGNASLNSPSGDVIQRSLVNLVFVDGQRGDSDLTVNGKILTQGSRTVSNAPSEGDGGGGSLVFFTLLLTVFSFFLRNPKVS